MEDDEQKTNPNLPANYVTIHDLRERWFKRQQQLNEKENVNQHQQRQQDEEEKNQNQLQQPKQNNNRQKPELVVVEKVSGEKEIKTEKKLERSEEKKKRNSSQKLRKNHWAEKSRREVTNHSQSAVESVPSARSETVDVAVKPRVRSVSEKKGTKRHHKSNLNDKIEVVVEKKSDSVTVEVEAKIENLSISSVNQLKVGRGGRERNRGGGGGGLRSIGGGRRNGVGPGPGPNQVWVRKGDAAVLIE